MVVAFNAGNLDPVAVTLRDELPSAQLIFCADDDVYTPGNPRLTKATTAAARAVGGLLAVPDFGKNRAEKATDFNDMALTVGVDSVRSCIANAKNPGRLPGTTRSRWCLRA